MIKEEILEKVRKNIELCELDYFTGSFSEETIKTDLGIRARIGGLAAKKNFYFDDFNKTSAFNDSMISKIQEDDSNHELLLRLERINNQLQKLRLIVYNF